MTILLLCMGNSAFAGEVPHYKARPFSQTGQASWYHHGEQGGKRTASGQPLNDHNPTAAHKSLPFNSRVRVTNLNNGKSVVVVITDRGPYHGGRIIDLNRKAAQQIDLTRTGTARVLIENIVEVAETPPDP